MHLVTWKYSSTSEITGFKEVEVQTGQVGHQEVRMGQVGREDQVEETEQEEVQVVVAEEAQEEEVEQI